MLSVKTIVALSVISVLLSQYLYSSSYLFTLCSHIHIHNDDALFNRQLQDKCKDVFKLNLNEQHVYNTVIRFINGKVFPKEIPRDRREWYKTMINSKGVTAVVNQLELVKYAHITLYMITCYFILVVLPKYVMDIFVFFCSKLLTVIYLIITVDFILYISNNNTWGFCVKAFEMFKQYFLETIAHYLNNNKYIN